MSKEKIFPALELLNLPAVNTKQAAYYLSLHCGSLRRWASHQTGPIKPIHVSKNRLYWNVADIRRVLGVQE